MRGTRSGGQGPGCRVGGTLEVVAPGCRFEGEFTQEFTWFPGYAWRFAMCRQCLAHLGWEYRGAASGFVGLIMTELRESWS